MFVKIKEKKDLKKILVEEAKLFNNTPDYSTLYEGGFNISGRHFNYMNSFTSEESERIFKPIVGKLFLEMESLYPDLGHCFLDIVIPAINKENNLLFIDDLISEIKEDSINFSKKDLDVFFENDLNPESHDILKTLLENINITTKIYLDKSYVSETIIVKKEGITFDLDFDLDFFYKGKWDAKDFNFIIIDGFIETVGEIYHLLHEANENKEPYVIFCKGMSSEVKDVFLQNISRETINICPISLKTSELNVNILIDIARCLEGDIVSALLGDTISQSVRRKLKKGKDISVTGNSITITPVASDQHLKTHLNYLENKKEKSNIQINTDVLEERIKMLSSDKISIRLGKKDISNKCLQKDIKKCLTFIKRASSGIYHCNNHKVLSKHFCIAPSFPVLSMLYKAKSFLKTIYSTEIAVIIDH